MSGGIAAGTVSLTPQPVIGVADGGAFAFEFWDAGHVLGSSGILLRAEGQTIFYTGDVNFDDQTIMQSAVFPQSDVDILIMEMHSR